MQKIHIYSISIAIFLCSWCSQAEQPDIEVYGKLPEVRAVSISPDGKHYAYIKREGDQEFFVVRATDTQEVEFAGETSDFKARATKFATNKYVLLWGSRTRMSGSARVLLEDSGALVYNIKTGKSKVLLQGTKDLHPAQTGLGRILGLHKDGEFVYMPAFDHTSPSKNLYKVKLKTGYGRIHEKGTKHTIDWFVDDSGSVLAREDFDKKDKQHRIYSKTSGKWQMIYSLDTEIMDISVQAVDFDSKALLFIDESDGREAVYSMNLDTGGINGPLFIKEDQDIDALKKDINRKLTAVIYSGFISEYDFFDVLENSLFDALRARFPNSSIEYISSTADNSKIIIKVSGMESSNSYMLFNTKDLSLAKLTSSYDVQDIGEIKAIKYSARDGLKIPAIITFPTNDIERKDLPLIALPHGGPESYDSIRFDWMAQYFAAKGYMVLQPNFRGSTGFGYEFRNKGHGKWGQEMQDDIADGIKVLVDAGYVDANKVCIVGGSYGGYAALAGGAFDPDIYRCIVSINGVADLPSMLGSNIRKYGGDHWVISYWKKVLGDSREGREKLKGISPANFASEFQAPVLLIHGKDDTVVPILQSERMAKALKKANKDVKLIRLKGEDHWLSTSATRLETLQAIDGFLDLHNPVN